MSSPKHEVDVIKEDDSYSLECICGWERKDIAKRPLARGISERHLLLNKVWPYENEEQHPDWLK